MEALTFLRSPGASQPSLTNPRLRPAEIGIAIIDRTSHHFFESLLCQMATGILAEGAVAPPIRDILRHQRNATVLLGEVQGIDLSKGGV